ncbi:hypothetical protein LCGC14_3102470, partial [marine sediment metagenome]
MNLSGGEQQRISLLLVLIKNPQILILDEPTSFLDIKNREKIVKVLKDFAIEGKIVIITSHDPHLVDIATNIYYIQDGRIIKDNLLSKISSSIEKPIIIRQAMNENQDFLNIPDFIYQQLDLGHIYSFNKISNKPLTYVLKLVDHNEFSQQNYQKWVLIDNP